jgi:hypothetical protein
MRFCEEAKGRMFFFEEKNQNTFGPYRVFIMSRAALAAL